MKNTYKFLIIALFVFAAAANLNAAISYSLDNSCGTNQLVISVTPDINYSGGDAVWSPAIFTISWPMSLGSGVLGAVSNQNGFAFATAGLVGDDGTYYYQKYAHTASPTLAMTAGVSYEVTRIAMIGGEGVFGTFEIPASDNAWIQFPNNGISVFSNSSGNQVPSVYPANTITDIPMFPGIFWDGISWCGGAGDNQQPGVADGAKNCYVYATGGSLTIWNANINQLLIDVSGQLTIQPGAALTAASTVTINGVEGLVVAADASGTGSFINTLSPVVYGASGSAKVQAYMKNVATIGTYHTHLVGPLVKDPAYSAGGTGVYLSDFNLQPSNTYAYRYNEPTDLWVNMWQLTDPVPSAAGIALSDVTSVSKVLSMTGQIATPNVFNPTISPWDPTITAGQGNGLHLFSNPFPSGVSLDEFYATNSGSTRFSGNNTFYFWEDEYANYSTWAADDPEFGGGTGILGIAAANGLINPGQSFFGQRNGTANIGFTAGHRIHVNTPFLKSNPIQMLRLTASGNYSKDEILIRFRENAEYNYDQKDAEKWASMVSEATEISTISADNYYLTINSLPVLPTGQMVSVPMTFKCGAEDTYTIEANNIESFDYGTEIWLEDLQTGAEWQSLVENPIYEFTAAPGEDENRFVVHFFSTTSIDDPNAEIEAVQIYAWGQDAYIVNRGKETIKEYVAYDMMGRELHRGTLPNSTVNKVTIGNVSAYYIVKVITKEGRIYTDKVYIAK